MTASSLRILGLAMQGDLAEFRSRPTAKNAALYAALDRRFSMVGFVSPQLPKLEHYLRLLRHAHPVREVWRARFDKSPAAFRRRSAEAERQLAGWDGRYDLIMQLHTMVAPGLRRDRPYVIHTDNAYILSDRHYRPWAPLRGRQRAEWLRLEGDTYRGAAFLFPRSEFLRRAMIEDYGCDPARVIRVGGGAHFAAHSLQGKRYDSQTALFVGKDFVRKGGEVLLRAWELVRRSLPNARLLIAGPKRPPARLPAGAEWLGRISDRKALSELYTSAALFVMPSLFEPWGHVFLEAMGHGLPCVSTRTGAIPEIVADGETGLLVPPGEPEPLAEALVGLLYSPPRAEELGRCGHAAVLRSQTWDDVVARMAPYIEQAVAEASPRPRIAL